MLSIATDNRKIDEKRFTRIHAKGVYNKAEFVNMIGFVKWQLRLVVFLLALIGGIIFFILLNLFFKTQKCSTQSVKYNKYTNTHIQAINSNDKTLKIYSTTYPYSTKIKNEKAQKRCYDSYTIIPLFVKAIPDTSQCIIHTIKTQNIPYYRKCSYHTAQIPKIGICERIGFRNIGYPYFMRSKYNDIKYDSTQSATETQYSSVEVFEDVI
jgi:hypothetical protein